MATGNAACTKARPTRAGFITLKPSPPNRDLPSPTAMKPATAAIHRGKPGGRVRASSNPVITTLKSRTVLSRRDIRQNRLSVARQLVRVTRINTSALMPNCHTDQAQTGSSA